MEKCNILAGTGVLLASALVAAPASAAVVNDGSSTTNLSQISNTTQVAATGAGSPGSTIQTNGDGTLRAEFANSTSGPGNAVKAAYITGDAPGSTTMTASTTMKLASTSNNDRAGVVIVDTTNNTGVGVYYRGGSGYRIVELNFNQAASGTNEIVLNGGATVAYPSGVTPTAYSTVDFSLSPNAGNSSLADLAVSFNGGSANTTLTAQNLSAYLPFANVANFRVGYWGYWAGTEANPVPDGEGGFLPNYVEAARFDSLGLTPLSVVTPPAAAYFTGTTSGSLNTLTNFATDLPGTVAAAVLPGGVTDVYFASSNATAANLANATVGLNVAVNSLTFGTGAAASNPTTIGGPGSITINAGNVAYAAGTGIVKQAGSAAVTINAPIVVAANQKWTNSSATALTIGGAVAIGNNDLTISGTSAGTTTVSGAISGNGGSVTVNGGGSVTLSGANTYLGTTTVSGAGTVLHVSTAAATPILSGPNGANIESGAISFDYTGGSPAGTIRNLLAAAFNAPTTPGVFDSGQLRSGTSNAARGLGYRDNGTSVLVKDAFYGDADLDGGVSINDFNALAGNFGSASGKVWTDGDFDYDGGVSINDFNLLAGGFGQSLPASSDLWAGLLAFAAAHNDLAAFDAATGVPEPTSLGLITACATLGLRRRRTA